MGACGEVRMEVVGRGAARLGEGLRPGGTDGGTRNIQQDLKQPQQARAARPGPRDPTACWKEEFPRGNQGRSSSLCRTGKLEKANGLAWSAVRK